MNKGLMGLRGYANGGGVGDPGDDWLEELVRQLQLRWMNTRGLSDTRMQDLALEADRLGLGIEGSDIAELDPSMLRFWGPDASIEDLISLANLDLTYGDPSDMSPTRIGPAPLPHAVPPLSDKPALWEDLRSMGIDHEDLIEGPSDILDQPIHDLAEAFADEEYRLQSRVVGEDSIDDLIRAAGGKPPLSDIPTLTEEIRTLGLDHDDLLDAGLMTDEYYYNLGSEVADIADRRDGLIPLGEQLDWLIGRSPVEPEVLQREVDISSLINVDDRYKRELPAYSLFDSPHRSGIGSLLNRLTSSSIPWGSIAAPLLAAAASPAALAAEQAFDFAISPESLGGTASEVPGAGRTWRESPHIDPSDKEVASFMLSLLPYTQHQLARPSTGSQRAIDELIRRAQAGTPVNRYRR